MYKPFVIGLILVVLTTGLLAAAGSEEAQPSQTDVLSLSWDQVIEQAQQEGTVVWYHWYLQDRFREIVAQFEAEYGIEVVVPDGTLEANRNKLLAERNRPTGDIDVLSIGGDVVQQIDLPELYLGPIVDVLPDGDKLRTRIQGGDTQGYAVAFWGNQTGIAYDPLRIDPADLPQTVVELSEWIESNPDDFGFNYENGGSGPAFIQSVARNLASQVDFSDGGDDPDKLAALAQVWDWFNTREDQFIITGGNADSLTRLNDGEFVMVPAWEDHLAGLQRSNQVDDRIAFYIPAFGMPGGGNVVGVPANAPHPAAALLLVSWIASAETQTLFNVELGAAPQHPDADSSQALIPFEQRAYATDWAPQPFGQTFLNEFVTNVILE